MAKIVVVDDDEMTCDILEKVLIREGHQVMSANNGDEGLVAVETFKPDLVITDIIMPKKDGIELIKELSKHYPSIPIIAISASQRLFTTDLNSAKLLGARAALKKPFVLSQLLFVLKECLK